MFTLLYTINTSQNHKRHACIFPHLIPIPKVSTEDYLKQAAGDIIKLLTNPVAHLPYLEVGDDTQNALLIISEALKRSITNIIPLSTTEQSTKDLPANIPRLPRVKNK